LIKETEKKKAKRIMHNIKLVSTNVLNKIY